MRILEGDIEGEGYADQFECRAQKRGHRPLPPDNQKEKQSSKGEKKHMSSHRDGSPELSLDTKAASSGEERCFLNACVAKVSSCSLEEDKV